MHERARTWAASDGSSTVFVYVEIDIGNFASRFTEGSVVIEQRTAIAGGLSNEQVEALFANSNENPDSVKYVVEIALHEEEQLAGRANWLDTKTGAVLGFVIVSVAELLGFLFLASGEKAKLPGVHLCPFAMFFFVGLGALVVASLLGLFELAPMRFKYGASTELLAPHVDKPVNEVRMLCLDFLRGTVAHNRQIVSKKANLAKATVIFVAVALFCYAAAVAILFLSLF